jgi:hypothetical protein
MAYWTKNEPNIEMVCAVKNRPARRAHPGIDSLASDSVTDSDAAVSLLGIQKA